MVRIVEAGSGLSARGHQRAQEQGGPFVPSRDDWDDETPPPLPFADAPPPPPDVVPQAPADRPGKDVAAQEGSTPTMPCAQATTGAGLRVLSSGTAGRRSPAPRPGPASGTDS
jgi:hypothetical protein